MNRHHLLHVYTGLRSELERLSTIVRPADAGAASQAFGLNVGTGIITDLSRMLWDPDGSESGADQDIH